jgi:PAS domain S-box-containing protein
MSPEGGATLLLVDDNAASLYATGHILRAAGFNVLEAPTGQDALRIAEEPVDAVILDVNLPDIDGFEVCRILRTREKTARTPIIHLSATFIGAMDMANGLNAGADGYLTHPVETPVLIATINAFMRARRAEEALRQSEEKFHTIFDKAINGIALMTKELEFVEVNSAMAGILGLTPKQIAGRPVSAYLAPGSEAQYEVIFQTLELQDVWSGAFPLRRADGQWIHLEWHISPFSSPDLLLVEVTDITQRRAAEVERERLLASERAARTQAERANRIKDEFLATVSHELRSPLNAIVGWAQFLKNYAKFDGKEYQTGIDAIDRNAKLQVRLIADLLDVSRITTGKLRLELTSVDFVELIRHSVASERNSALAKSIAIDEVIHEEKLTVLGDPGRLQQAMTNLLTNAIKFTPPDGRIRVSLKKHPTHVEVSVTDSGQGISADFLPYIFDTFRQEDAGFSRVHQGLGLGLAIAKRVIEMHGGNIAAQSEGKDKGSTFIIHLPLSRIQANGKGNSANNNTFGIPLPSDVLRGLEILVVDDDADSRQLTRQILTNHAAVVTEASTVKEALGLIETSEPQVLVSDIGMPGTDGYELIRQVRADGHTTDRLPAIAVTAYARAEDRVHVLSSGYQAHVTKPIDPEELIATIATLSRRAH